MLTLIMEKRTIKQLSGYLENRGVTHTGAKKPKLVQLANMCHDQNLPIIKTPSQTENERDEDRRNVEFNGNFVILPRHQDLTDWSPDLSTQPPVNHVTASVFLHKKCGWKIEDLPEYKQTQGYHLCNGKHIFDVKAKQINADYY